MLDCLVIGGGPAGLTAAIYLARFRRQVLVIDKGWSRAEWITLSHNLPGFPEGLPGPTLLARLQEQARLYGAVIQTGVVETLKQAPDQFFSAIVGETVMRAKNIVLCTGVMENKPPLAHVADAVKRGLIRTCPICDGYESIGKRVAVLGEGDHAAAEALFIRTYTEKVWLFLMTTDTTVLSTARQDDLKAAGIPFAHVVVGSIALDAHGGTALTVEDDQSHSFDVIYSAFGLTSQTQLATALGAKVDSSARLFVNEHQATSIDGLFAAGDLVRGLNQISVAEGEAAIAATAIHNRLPRRFA